MRNTLLSMLKENQITISENKSSYPSDILASLDKILNYGDNNYTTKFNNMESLLGIKTHLMNFQFNNMNIFIDLENEENKKISHFFYELLVQFENFTNYYLQDNLDEASKNDAILLFSDKNDETIKEYIEKVYKNDKIYKKFLDGKIKDNDEDKIKTSEDLAKYLLNFINDVRFEENAIDLVENEILKFK